MAVTDSVAPLILGVSYTIATLSLSFCSLRLYIKLKYRGKLWYDDYALIASVVFLLANTGLVQANIGFGYGKHLAEIIATNPQNIRRIYSNIHALAGIVRLSTNTARISFAITLLPLSKKWEKRFVWFTIISLLASTIPAIIVGPLSCIPYSKIFDRTIPGTCIDGQAFRTYLMVLGGYTAVIDFALVALPWWILSQLQMRRVEKLGASIAMSLGILSGVVTIIKTAHLTQILDPDWTYTSAPLSIWNMVEPGSVIIAASIPNLRVFIMKNAKNLKTNLGMGSGPPPDVEGARPRADDIDLESVQNTMKAISAGSATRREEATTWVTSRAKGDNDSDKSILNEEDRGFPNSGIIQTSTFTVEYPDESTSVSTGDGRQHPNFYC